MQAQAFLDDAAALRQMAEMCSEAFENARENEREFGGKESGERFSRKKPHYAKVGGRFSDALLAEEWAKYTHSMTTGLDAGLRVSEDSILVACEDGNYKYVIYDNDSRDKDIIAIYKIDQVNYNITNAKAIATTIKCMEDKGFDQQKILDRLLSNHARSHGYLLSRYNPVSKRFVNVGRSRANNQRVNQRHSGGTGVSGQAQSGALGGNSGAGSGGSRRSSIGSRGNSGSGINSGSNSQNSGNQSGKYSKDDTIFDDFEDEEVMFTADGDIAFDGFGADAQRKA